MESLKIALATDWFFPSYGGVEYHVHDLAVRLVERGHEVHVITRIGSYPDETLPYPVHRFKGDFNLDHLHVSLGPGLLAKINELYKREHFDITHAHSIFSPLAVGTANLSSGIRGVPSVITDHSLMNKSLASPVYRLILRHSLGKVNAFIAVSEAVKEDLERILGKKLRGRPIYVIPNAIDLDFWRPPPQEEKEAWKEELGLDGIVVTTTSRLTKKKRVHIIPRIAKEVVDAGYDDVTFVLIGDGPLRRKIRERIQRYGLEDTVRMVGRKPREEVRRYLWASDIYLSPTIYEAFGIAVLEAQATEVPVVARNDGGVREIVMDGVTGFLAGNDGELVEGILTLIEDPVLRRKMGREARKWIVGKFSWDTVVNRILEVYRRTIDEFDENYYLLYRVGQRILKGRKV